MTRERFPGEKVKNQGEGDHKSGWGGRTEGFLNATID